MWQDKANCKNMDMNLFFPELGATYLPFVREVCSDCKVVEECLWYANELNADYGFFGGMSPKERSGWRKVNHVQLGDRRAA